MVDHKVTWSASSLRDLKQAHQLLAEQSKKAADQIVRQLLDRVIQLEKFPNSGPLEPNLAHRKKAHRYLVSGHYKIVHRVEQKKHTYCKSF